MAKPEFEAQLTRTLEDMGHTPEEIKLILERVRQYDQQTAYDSVMDSLATDKVRLRDIIREALGGSKSKKS